MHPISFSLLCMIVALVLFVLAAIPRVPQSFPFVAAGLAFATLAFLLGGYSL